MSLDVRHLSNGEKEIYSVTDFGVRTIYERLEDVPKSIRYYAEKEKLKVVKPDMARMLGVLDVLYPNFPNCGMEGYENKKCIAESCCEYPLGEDWSKCPYYKSN